MRCLRFERLLEDYRFGLLSARAQRKMDEHLAECETCRGIHDADRSLDDLLESWQVEPPDPRFPDRVVARLAETPERRPIYIRVPLGLAVAFSILLAASLMANYQWLRNRVLPPEPAPVRQATASTLDYRRAADLTIIPAEFDAPSGEAEAEPLFW